MAAFCRSNELGLLLFDQSSSSIQWYSRCGHRLLGKYGCSMTPIDMTICTFSSNGKYNLSKDPTKADESKSIAIVVLEKPRILRIYSSRGDSYDVNLSYEISRLSAFPSGLILESALHVPDTFRGENSAFSVDLLSLDFYSSNLLHLSHPLASPVPLTQGVYHATMSTLEQARRQSIESIMSGIDLVSPRSPDALVNAKDMVVLGTQGNLVLVYQYSSGRVALLLATSKDAMTAYLEETFPMVTTSAPGSTERSGRMPTTPFSPNQQPLSPDSSAMRLDSARLASPFNYFRAASPSLPGLEHLAHVQSANDPMNRFLSSHLTRPSTTKSKVNYFSKHSSIQSTSQSLNRHANEHQRKPNRHSSGRASVSRMSTQGHLGEGTAPESDLAAVLLGERRRTVEPDLEREAYRDRERVNKRKLSISLRSNLSTSPTYDKAPAAYLGLTNPNSGSGKTLLQDTNVTDFSSIGFTSIAASASTLPSSAPSSLHPGSSAGVAAMRRESAGVDVSRRPGSVQGTEARTLFIDTAAVTASHPVMTTSRELPPIHTAISPSNQRLSGQGPPVSDVEYANMNLSRSHEPDSIPNSWLLLPLASYLPTDSSVFPSVADAPARSTNVVMQHLKQLVVEFVGSLDSPFGLYIHVLNPANRAQLHYRVSVETKELHSARVTSPAWSTHELDQVKFVQGNQFVMTPVDLSAALLSSGQASLCSDFQFQCPHTIFTPPSLSLSQSGILSYAGHAISLSPMSMCQVSLDVNLAVSGQLAHSTRLSGKSSCQLPLLMTVNSREQGLYVATFVLGNSVVATVPLVWNSEDDAGLSWDHFSALLADEPPSTGTAMSVDSPTTARDPVMTHPSMASTQVLSLANGLTTHFLVSQRDVNRTRYSVLRLPVDLFQTPLLSDCVKAVLDVMCAESSTVQSAIVSFLFVLVLKKKDNPIFHLLTALFGLTLSDGTEDELSRSLGTELRSVWTRESESSLLPLRVFDALHSVLEDQRLVHPYSADTDTAVGLLRGLYTVAYFYSSTSESDAVYAKHYLSLQPSLAMLSPARLMEASNPPLQSFTCNVQSPCIVDGKVWLSDCLSIVSESIQACKTGGSYTLVNPQRILLPAFVPDLNSPSGNNKTRTGWSAHQPFASIHLLHRLFQNVMMGLRLHVKSAAGHSSHPPVQELDKVSWRMILSKAFVSAIKSSESGHSLDDGSTLDVLTILQKLPTAIRAAVTVSLLLSKEQPSSRWPTEVLSFIGRQDIALRVNRRLFAHQLEPNENRPQYRLLNQQDGALVRLDSQLPARNDPPSSAQAKVIPVENLDGLKEIESLSFEWFPQDERVHEVCRMLKSSKHIYLRVDRAPEWSDEDYRERRQAKLLLLGRRALALSVGRGMATMQTLVPLMAEPLPLPQLIISARCPPNNAILALDPAAMAPEFMAWPDFHNGAAAGLRIGFASPSPLELYTDKRAKLRVSSSDSGNTQFHVTSHRQRRVGTSITRNFIAYNKSDAFTNGRQSAFAGCLLTLGLQGHLKVLSKNDIVEYLSSRDDQLSIATLIGVGASRLGSADPQTSKALCMQVPALLPPSWSFDVEISSLVQCAAFTGLGLLYCGTGHRLMAELLLDELTRKPSPHSCTNREGIALSVSWALGMVLLGKGESMQSIEPESPTADVTMNSARHDAPSSNHPAATSSKPVIASSGEVESDSLLGLADLQIEDRLHLLIHGGKRPDPQQSLFAQPQAGFDQHSRSSRVLERDFINTDVTSIGSTIALALIYLRTNNADIARRVALPTTALQLDAIRPDFMLYRALASCLILWDSVRPSEMWLNDLIPHEVKKVLLSPTKVQASATNHSASAMKNDATGAATAASSTSAKQDPTTERVLEPKLSKFELKLASVAASSAAVNAPNSSTTGSGGQRELAPFIALSLYLNTVAGLCLGVGMVHAGTADPSAKDLLLKQLLVLQGLRDGKPAGDIFKIKFSVTKVLRPTLECCIGTVSLALSCVMAGSGDLDSLRVIRELRWKTEDSASSGVTYGTHMSLNMAIGMLFLSGGRASLRRNDPVSTACLLISVLPRYPMKTLDNQYHLQALRHLYAIAVEPRALQTVDVDTGESVPLLLEIVLSDGSKIYKATPCLLPELCTVKAVHMKTELIDTLSGDKIGRLKRATRLQVQEILKTKDTYRNKDYLPASLDLEQESFESKLFVKRRGSPNLASGDTVQTADSKLTTSAAGKSASLQLVSQIMEPLASLELAEHEEGQSSASLLRSLLSEAKDKSVSATGEIAQAELTELLGALTGPLVSTSDTVSNAGDVALSNAVRSFVPFILLCDEASWKL